MDESDRLRLQHYIQSQNYFEGVGEHLIDVLLQQFIQRYLPRLLAKIEEAMQAAWSYIRRRLGRR